MYMPSVSPRMLSANGIDATTGEPLRSATLEQIAAVACGEQAPTGESEELRRLAASLREDHLDTRFQVDSRDLAEAGWGVIFPAGKEDALRQALAPLLAL